MTVRELKMHLDPHLADSRIDVKEPKLSYHSGCT